MHQERLRGNFDAGALRKNDSAAVDDIENRDGLARFALRIKRVPAEIYEIEGDADDQQDWPSVTRLGDVAEPIRRCVRVAGLQPRSRLGVGERDLFRAQKPDL
jgi:hypothetical protein